MIGYQNNGNKIKILNAKNEEEGIRAEHHLLNFAFSVMNLEYRILEQIVEHKTDGRVIDNVLVYSNENKVYEFWFDITDFYGRI